MMHVHRRKYITAFIFFLEKYLPATPTVSALIAMVKKDPKILENLLKELDMVIELFNKSPQFGKELINATKLKKLMGDKKLPSANSAGNDLFVDSMNKNDKLFKDFLAEFSQFKFIQSMRNPQQLLGCLMVAIYRTYMLVKYPYLKERGAQVASALEEMFAIMAMKGQDTQLFQATKQWIADWEKEGFSPKLAQKTSRL